MRGCRNPSDASCARRNSRFLRHRDSFRRSAARNRARSWRRIRERCAAWSYASGNGAESCRSLRKGGMDEEAERVEGWRSWSIERKIFEIPGEPRDDSISQRPLNGPLWTMRHHRSRSFSVFEGRTFFAGGRLCQLRHPHRRRPTMSLQRGATSLFDFSPGRCQIDRWFSCEIVERVGTLRSASSRESAVHVLNVLPTSVLSSPDFSKRRWAKYTHGACTRDT